MAEHLDEEIFRELLELDDPGDWNHEFSRSLLQEFFDQVENELSSMHQHMRCMEYKNMADAAHLLKGSSATLGLRKLRRICAELQSMAMSENASAVHTDYGRDQLLRTIEELNEEAHRMKELINILFQDPKNILVNMKSTSA